MQGHLYATWSEWFDNLAVTHDVDDGTTLIDPVVDQAALYGLINKARDLGMLLAVVRSEPAVLDNTPAPHDPV